MKKILILLILCFNVYGFEYLNPMQKLPSKITYNCDNPLLEKSFIRIFNIWNYVCDNIFKIEKSDNPILTIKFVKELPLKDIGAMTITTNGNIIIMILSVDNLHFSEVTILHELGHAFGLDHSKVDHSIMQAILKNEATLIQDDIDGIREHYDLSPKVFDFQLKIKNKEIKCIGYCNMNWIINKKIIYNKKKINYNFHKRGSYQIEAIDPIHSISIYKTLNILPKTK